MFALIHRTTRTRRRMNVDLDHLLLFIYKRALFTWLPSCACDQILKNGREDAFHNVDLGLAPALLRETNGHPCVM